MLCGPDHEPKYETGNVRNPARRQSPGLQAKPRLIAVLETSVVFRLSRDTRQVRFGSGSAAGETGSGVTKVLGYDERKPLECRVCFRSDLRAVASARPCPTAKRSFSRRKAVRTTGAGLQQGFRVSEAGRTSGSWRELHSSGQPVSPSEESKIDLSASSAPTAPPLQPQTPKVDPSANASPAGTPSSAPVLRGGAAQMSSDPASSSYPDPKTLPGAPARAPARRQ